MPLPRIDNTLLPEVRDLALAEIIEYEARMENIVRDGSQEAEAEEADFLEILEALRGIAEARDLPAAVWRMREMQDCILAPVGLRLEDWPQLSLPVRQARVSEIESLLQSVDTDSEVESLLDELYVILGVTNGFGFPPSPEEAALRAKTLSCLRPNYASEPPNEKEGIVWEMGQILEGAKELWEKNPSEAVLFAREHLGKMQDLYSQLQKLGEYPPIAEENLEDLISISRVAM